MIFYLIYLYLSIKLNKHVKNLINLDKLKKRRALNLLIPYTGNNPYIKRLQKEYELYGKVNMTESQSNYVIENIDFEPIKIDRVVEITEFAAKFLQKQDGLTITPTKILIEYILSDNGDRIHFYGKLKRNQKKSSMYFVSKTQLVDDPYFEPINIDVDFTPYIESDNFELSDGTIGRIPYEHQKEGVKFLLSRPKSILADDMGLGKTYISVIAALESKAEKILIVCPSSLKINWQREINYLTDDSVSIIDGKDWISGSKFTIINFDILKNFTTIGKDPDDTMKRYTNELNEEKFDLIIVDEAHNLKNPKSNRGKILQDVALKEHVERVWLLTGTPISNRPMDYFNLLKIIESPIASNWNFFAKRYCEMKKFTRECKNGKKITNYVTDGASNLDELYLKTKNTLLRRKKTEVLDMPDKTIIANTLDLTNSEVLEYEDLWGEYLLKRKNEGKRNNHKIIESKDMIEIGLLRKFIGLKAIPHTIKLAENAIEQGNKVIIFTNYTEELETLAQYFGDISVIHHGPMNDKQKQKSVDDFQKKDKIKVFIGNIVSAGVGITLTASNIVIFNSFDWVPGLNEQCEDRSYRIGQKNNVTIYYQLFKNTISQRIWATLKRKKEIISQIIGDEYEENYIINRIIDLTEEDE